MHQQSAVGTEHGDRHGSVPQAVGAHLGAGDHAHHPVVLVDHVDQFVRGTR
jgi:hypothetical protein